MPKLTFVGTGEAFDPGLPNTSVLYSGSKNILVDCGFSVPHAFWQVSQNPDLLDAIYITHIHADHTFGLPALLLWMRIAGRTRPLRVLGGSGVGRWLSRLLGLAYPGAYDLAKCYPIEPVAIRPHSPHIWDDLVVSVAPSEHPVRNLAVRFEESGRAACVSGDGIPTDATRALFRGAAVLSHECYYLTESKNGHAALDELLQVAGTCQVETLCLVHISVEQKAAVTAAALSHAAPGMHRVLVPRPTTTVEY